jgi:uncharacterized protein (DUF1919 family)
MLSAWKNKKELNHKLKNKTFTIISSNCWGSSVYEDVGLQYLTPTVGLFFYAPCYIKFLKKLNHFLSFELEFSKKSRYEDANAAREKKWYPLGNLGDVEIHFLHYKTEAEAKKKWNRRMKRIHLENLFVSFTDRDHCTEKHIHEFDNLSFKNKVCFTAREYKNCNSVVWVKEYAGAPFVGDLYTERKMVEKHFDVIKWINSSSTSTND